MLIVEGIFFLGVAAALIYLIVKRIEAKKIEDFEDRQN